MNEISSAYTLLNAVDGSVNQSSPPLTLNGRKQYNIQVDFSGSNLAGTLKLQYRNDAALKWIDYDGSTVAVTSASSVAWNDTSANFIDLRIVWTATSGTGTITAVAIVKGVQA